jgi:lysine-specific demethylase 8
MNMMQCDTLHYRDFGRFNRDYYLPNRPVVITGIRDTKALKIHQWSARYFGDLMPNTVVPVLATTTGFLSYERNVSAMTFGDFVTRSFGPNPDPAVRYYYKNSTDLLPVGHDDSDSIEGIAPYIAKAMMRNLWISGSGLTVGLHFDAAENFNMQLRGHKAFYLWPPGVRDYYPLPMFSQTAHISGVYRNGPTPDLTQFPHFSPAKGLRIDLCEGDVLYIPAYWWHQVESLGAENLNLNFWWLPSLQKQLFNWNQALRGHLQLALRYMKFGDLQKAPSQRSKQNEPHR